MGGISEGVRQWTRGRRSSLPARRAGRRAARWAALVALVALGACSDGGATDPGPPAPSPNDPVAGSFALTTVNQQPVPYPVFSETGYRLELTQGTLALLAEGKFVLALTSVETVAGFASTFQDTTRGSWTQNAGNVALAAADGTAAAATWDGRQLGFELDYDGRALRVVYRKTP